MSLSDGNNSCSKIYFGMLLGEFIPCVSKRGKDDNAKAIEQFKTHIKTSNALKVKAISRNILITAAEVRNQFSLKLPDAIHMATAIDEQYKTFISNNHKLKTPDSMKEFI